MASTRLQVTLSGPALEFLIDHGRSATTPATLWATTGLRHALDEWLDNPASGYAEWLAKREASE